MTGIDARFRLDWPGFILDVDLSLPGRGVTALFGHSGSGKTTLLRCIAGLERAREGRLTVNGEVWQDERHWLPTHKRPIGYVFQEASLFPHLSVLGNLRYGMKRMFDPQRVSLDHAIELLGIGHLLDRRPDTLSGGERQRLSIAALLVQQPRLYLLDEPLAHLDLHHQIQVLEHFATLAAGGAGVVMVLHDINLAARYASHVLLLDGEGGHAFGRAAEILTAPRLSAAFGHPLRAVADGDTTLFVPC